MARQGGDRGQPGRGFLGSRTRAPGLPAALPQRVHVPLRPARLEATPTDRRICTAGQPFTRTRDLNAGPSWPSASAHHHPTAILRGECNSSTVAALARGRGGLEGEVAQHRSQHHIHLHVGECGPDTAAGPAAKDPRKRGWLTSDVALRVEAIRLRKTSGSPCIWAILIMIEYPRGITHSPSW